MENSLPSTTTGSHLPLTQSGSTIFGTGAEECNDTTRRLRSLADFEAEAMPHMNDLFRTDARVLREAPRAEDVVQEVYLQAWKSFDRFEPGTNCKAWLYRILFHSVNHLSAQVVPAQAIQRERGALRRNAHVDAAAAGGPHRRGDLAALDNIPPDYKSLVLLVDVEEFAHKEAAGILQIPIGTVMSRLSRGRKLLREQLADTARAFGIGKSVVEGRI